jgi:hypothetical protein
MGNDSRVALYYLDSQTMFKQSLKKIRLIMISFDDYL